MSKMIDVAATCELLRGCDDVLIIMHQKPDGDCLGSAFALLWALESIGKRARVECSDEIPERYKAFTGDYTPLDFEPRFIITVDIASAQLLGNLQTAWENRLDLCIDHHRVNTLQPRYKFLNPDVPAAAQLIYQIVKELGIPFDKKTSTAIFAGIVADTGGFRYSSVTAQTFHIAAEMIEAGADHTMVNTVYFDTRSRPLVELDKIIANNLEYHFGGLCALMTIYRADTDRLGVDEADLDGIATIPRRIQGVEAGIVLRENFDSYRVSVRSRNAVDSSVLCAKFGGGGHRGAGGCTIEGDEAAVRQALLPAVGQALREAGFNWE